MRSITRHAAGLLMLGALVAGSGTWAPASAGAAEGSAAPDPTFPITEMVASGCGSGEMGFWARATGMPELAGYLTRTHATVAGQTFSDEAADVVGTGADKSYYWSIYDLFSYPGSPTTGRGTWPMPAGTPIVLDLTLEDGFGRLLHGWTSVIDRCDGGRLVANGPARTLTLANQGDRRRLTGRLTSYGAPETYVGTRIRVWKVRPGPDRRVASMRTSEAGGFSVRPQGRGRYYVTSPRLRSALGETLTSERSETVRVGP